MMTKEELREFIKRYSCPVDIQVHTSKCSRPSWEGYTLKNARITKEQAQESKKENDLT